VIIEEPERNIHPYLISKVMEMMKDASRRKQIIATTHNAEIVRNAELQSILLISRNKSGFSSISRPSMKEEVKKFLENEIGIHDLFIQDLLK
jgi:predicted ATPase